MSEVIKKYIPNDFSKHVQLSYYTEKILNLKDSETKLFVLDLGCGEGESLKYFQSLNKNIEWFGVDLEYSPEVSSRTGSSDRFITFDGINIPFPDNHFDVIYCKQVFEHVKNPRELLKEVYRVLKNDGAFVGSTSHLEPYHSYSYWNYTPFGFSVLLEEAKLELIELRPSIDAFTLLIRRLFRCWKIFDIFWRIESPLNLSITVIGKLLRISNYNINSIKLLFCGQFFFFAKKVNYKNTK